eukprot:2017544-Karenia_brevis.AAC.1
MKRRCMYHYRREANDVVRRKGFNHASPAVLDAIAVKCKGLLLKRISFSAAIFDFERGWQWNPVPTVGHACYVLPAAIIHASPV